MRHILLKGSSLNSSWKSCCSTKHIFPSLYTYVAVRNERSFQCTISGMWIIWERQWLIRRSLIKKSCRILIRLSYPSFQSIQTEEKPTMVSFICSGNRLNWINIQLSSFRFFLYNIATAKYSFLNLITLFSINRINFLSSCLRYKKELRRYLDFSVYLFIWTWSSKFYPW